ncbi:hypothetical protein EDB80DRAFT_743733, partial [Ilyonectria destructans]
MDQYSHLFDPLDDCVLQNPDFLNAPFYLPIPELEADSTWLLDVTTAPLGSLDDMSASPSPFGVEQAIPPNSIGGFATPQNWLASSIPLDEPTSVNYGYGAASDSTQVIPRATEWEGFLSEKALSRTQNSSSSASPLTVAHSSFLDIVDVPTASVAGAPLGLSLDSMSGLGRPELRPSQEEPGPCTKRQDFTLPGSPNCASMLTRRRHVDSDDDDFGLDGGNVRSRKSQGTTFACPFYRRDPHRHMDCMHRQLMRIRDVKQHIQRQHAAERDCPRCHASFSSKRRRNEHIRERNCELKLVDAGDYLHFVSAGTQDRLKVRASKTLSPDQQWYAIWDILFEPASRPQDPYLGTITDETVGMMREFWEKQGDTIVRDVLDSAQIPSRDRDRGELHELLIGIFKEVQARF